MSFDAGNARHNNNDKHESSFLQGFPSLERTVEMAFLSRLVYRFKHEDDDKVCDMINNNGNLTTETAITTTTTTTTNVMNNNHWTDGPGLPMQLRCHWYHHDRVEGTQVMLVSTKDYIAVVFAGTDDLKTSLPDINVLEVHPSFDFNQPGSASSFYYDDRMRIHAGFNRAVFHEVFTNLTQHLDDLLLQGQILPPPPPSETTTTRKQKTTTTSTTTDGFPPRLLYTTGHSLGAANAILTALALQATPRYQRNDSDHDNNNNNHHLLKLNVSTINFGCPRIGNTYFRDFANNFTRTPIWRVVLGWDLVPRVPEFLLHVGHTIHLTKSTSSSLWSSGSTKERDKNSTSSSSSWNASTYYHHYGEPSLGYAGVPFGWSATSFLWVPGGLESHKMHRYLVGLQNNVSASDWAHSFVHIPSNNDNSDQDHQHDHVDDDFMADPPDSTTVLPLW